MRRIRNPRFAPEFLEKKLSPSDLGVTVTVEVATIDPPPCPDIPALPGAPEPAGPNAPPSDPLYPGGLTVAIA